MRLHHLARTVVFLASISVGHGADSADARRPIASEETGTEVRSALRLKAPGVIRFQENPIIRPAMLPGGAEGEGINICGPSLIRVPDWLPHPLGKYYLYFAHHKGSHIRLAYADRLEGPWTIYAPGTLKLDDILAIDQRGYTSGQDSHIGSPDVHVDDEKKEIRMYFHVSVLPMDTWGHNSGVALSKDGITFKPEPGKIGEPYMRVFRWNDYYYTMTRAGNLARSKDGLTNWEEREDTFLQGNRVMGKFAAAAHDEKARAFMRHTALKRDDNILSVYFSRTGDVPESIMLSQVELTGDWTTWVMSKPVIVLKPEMDYEGAGLPVQISRPGSTLRRDPQPALQDPCIYQEGGKTFLLYSVIGERGIAIAELKDTVMGRLAGVPGADAGPSGQPDARRADGGDVDPGGVAAQGRWYRGNTHSHTTLCGHADSTPEEVARWYHDHGYNFLVLSEHQRFIDPVTVTMPSPPRSDFILIGGSELSRIPVHATGVNMAASVTPTPRMPTNVEMIQTHLDKITGVGGLTILNHPIPSGVTAADILAVKDLLLFEVFNAAPATKSLGSGESDSVEAMWDEILTAGKVLWGVGSDDSHQFTIWDYKGEALPNGRVNNPGRGWVMVQADELTPAAITQALRRGRFYASNSVFLKRADHAADVFHLEVDDAKTAAELLKSTIMGIPTSSTDQGYEILFIGPGGKVLQSTRGTSASIAITSANAYVRGKVIFRTQRYGKSVEFYAWTQPIFTDGRVVP